MEAGGGARGAAADGAVSLDAFFSTLEKELRLHLRAFVAQWAAAGGGAVDEIASHDVRLMVQNLGRRWDDHGAGQAGKTRDLRLEGSPIIAANFYTIHTVLNRYHHKSTTHWEVIEQGVDCAVRLLRALHTYAGVDTRQSVSGLLDRWQAVEKIGHSAYDHSVKIAVEDVTDDRSRASGSCGPRLLLRNLPAEASVRAVIWALQAQDVDVAESQVHLAGTAGGPEAEEGDDGAGVAPSEAFVELNSADEQRALLELGTITIKRTPVELVKPEETREVVLYLHKRLSAEIIAGAWENEFGQVLAEGAVEYADAAGHVTVVRLTPEQFAEVEGKTITLLRADVQLLPWRPAHAVKLQLPAADMSAYSVRSIVARNLDGAAAAIEALVLLDARSCAFVHLASPAAKAQLLQKKHLDASDTVPSTIPPASPTTTSPSSATTTTATKHQDHAVPMQATTAAVPATSPAAVAAAAAGVELELKTEGGANSESTPDRTPVGEASGTPPTGEWRVLALSPLPGAAEAGTQVPVEQVAELMRAQLGIEPKFISVLRYKAYVRYHPSPSDPVIAVGQTVTHNGALVNVETIAGDLPCWRIGIRTGALPGKPHNAHVAVPAFLQFLANSAPLQVGRSCITPIDEATVEIGTEALFKQLLALQSQTMNGVALTFFDARLDRTEQLDDVALVYYLTMKKKGKPVLSGIEKVYSVTTTAFWVYASPTATSSTTAAASNPGAARAKVAFVRIVGQSPESVDAAWKRLCAHLATVVRRRTQFTFLREEVLFRACFKRKLKPLFWRYASTAMHVDDPEDGGVAQSVVVIHIVGPSAQEVARLAQEPNHIRTRLVGERSQPVLASPQQLDLAALEKEFDVAVAADWNAKQLKVVGYRDSVRACLAHVHALCAKATAGAESAAPATTAGNPHATAAATPTAPAAAPAPAAAKPQAQREFTKTIEFAPIEAAAVQRLNLSVVRSKFGVYTKVNMAKRTITFTGPVAPALETASSFVRWFINNGTRMQKKPAVAATPSGGTTASTTTSTTTKPFVFGADTLTS